MNRKFKESETTASAGFTLVEVMIAGAIMAVVGLLFATMLSNQSKSLQGVRTLSARDDLKVRLSRYIADANSLLWTANSPPNGLTPNPTVSARPENQIFSSCVIGGSTNCPNTAVVSGTTITGVKGFALTDNNGNIVADGTGYTFDINPATQTITVKGGGVDYLAGGLSTANPAGPIFYDNNGAPCTPVGVPQGQGTSNCGIAAFAGFYATCPTAASPCDQAQSVTVIYAIEQAPGVKLTAGSPNMATRWAEVTSVIPLSTATGTAGFLAKWDSSILVGASGVVAESAIKNYPTNYGVVIGQPTTTNPQTQSLDPSDNGAIPGNQVLIDVGNGPGTGNALAFSAPSGGAESPISHIKVKGTSTTIFDDTSGTAVKAIEFGSAVGVELGAAGSEVTINNGSMTVPQSVSVTAGGINVGGGAPAGAGNLTVSNSIQAGTYYYPSDIKLKKDVHEIDHALEKALKLRGVSFEWKKDGRKDLGVIAQEVEKVFPELVHTDANGAKSVEYGNLTAILLSALKEENQRLDDMSARLETIEKALKKASPPSK